MKEPISNLGSSLNREAASEKKHNTVTQLVEEQTVRDCSDAGRAALVGSLDGEVRVRCTAEVHARA